MMIVRDTVVESDEELALLTALSTDCMAGHGCVAVISGPAASGKAELVDGFAADAAERGALVLRATGARQGDDEPVSVVGRLLRSAAQTSPRAAGMARLVSDGALAEALGAVDGDETPEHAAQLLHSLLRILLDLAERSPVLICLSAAHEADTASLQWLLGLGRRLSSTRLMLVLTEDGSLDAAVLAELLALPRCRHIRLSPLSIAALDRIIGDRLQDRRDDPPTWSLAVRYHAMTGGNRLLLNALIRDEQRPARSGNRAFTDAVLDAFGRMTVMTRTVGLALVVLDPFGKPELLGEVLGIDRITTVTALKSLSDAGLVDAGRFRVPAAREAILASTTSAQRIQLSLRAAEVLHEARAPAREVTRHLVAADRADQPWAVALLLDGAGQDLRDGAPLNAMPQLRLAARAATDEKQRATAVALLAHAEWWAHPETAGQHVDDLVRAVHDGHLRGRPAILAAKHLLWYGRAAEAAVALDQLTAATQESASQLAVDDASAWLAYMSPPLALRLAEPTIGAGRPRPGIRPADPLIAALARPGEDALGLVEQLLQRALLDPRMVEPVLPAVAALIFLDQPERAVTWCDLLGTRAGLAMAPTWQAMLDTVRAQAALRLGDLPGAERRAQSALARIPAAGWGVAIGAVRAALVLATTEMGRLDQARDVLDQPVPEAMMETSFGVSYLYARGRHRLAADQPHEALENFRACGERLTRWGFEAPMPWRVDSAHALIRLGDVAAARELLEGELSGTRSVSPRSRGAALRAFAKTVGRRKQAPVLSEAVQVLQACGDRLELAHALADLSETYYALGESNRARITARRAYHLARVCHAEPLIAALRPTRTEPVDLAPDAAGNALSEAEQRVAMLAAQGYSNREIAQKLFITNSTVEQHLTRIYRKLQVTGRSSLPIWLQLDATEHA